jgi:hypothetical protein
VRSLNLILDLGHPGKAGMAVGGDVIREAADTAREVQWDEKRQGRPRNLAADYNYVHEHCGYGAVNSLPRHRWCEP